jgi:Tol biopolymer transport system component
MGKGACMPQQDSARPSFEQFTAVRRYGGRLTFSPDGSEIAYSTDISGQFNLWRQSSEGGYPHQLTLYADQSVRDFRLVAGRDDNTLHGGSAR